MVTSSASTVEEYLDELPADRRELVLAARDLVLAHLPDGYVETMNWGMISYEIPLDRYPDTHNGQPLGVVAIAAQQRHTAIYLHGVYASPELLRQLVESYDAAGVRLDMGKSCLRFTRLDRLVPEAVGAVIAAVPPERYIELYEASRRR